MRTNPSAENGRPVRLIIGNDGSIEATAMIQSVAVRSWPEGSEAQTISVIQTLVPEVTPLEANTYAREAAYGVIRDADTHMRARLENVAAESAHILRQAGLIATSKVIDGDPGHLIVEQANAFNADAIFVGARGLGRMERLVLGSVSSYVVTHARCTVEVVRHKA
jgi:nucleotide-binding universal stress UspA family protein